MKAVFLNNDKGSIARVYAPETIERICNLVDADPVSYTKDEIMQNPEKFRDTQFIFSTWGMVLFTEEEIAEVFPNLEAVFYAAGTVQHFARPFLHRGVKIFSAWIANAVPVAEYTVAQIILANKGYFLRAGLMSNGVVTQAREMAQYYPGNYDATIGIIGTGAIGKFVCEMLKPYRLRVLAYSRSLTEEKAKALGVEKSDIETIFRTCNVVSNHLANNANTQKMLTKEHFASMRPYATFLNTGRGAQVDEEGMTEVLKERPDLVAVLDVTNPEPPVPGSPLFDLPNCIITPHIAGSAGNEVHRMSEWMADEFELYIRGEACRYEVTEEMLKTMA